MPNLRLQVGQNPGATSEAPSNYGNFYESVTCITVTYNASRLYST
jgi:hypothetical protein